METKTLPHMIYAEATPNPATMKFVSNHALEPSGQVYQYDSEASAQQCPLAQRLFSFPFVKSVFITQNFITVTKIGGVEWSDITLELREYIRDYLNAGYPVFTEFQPQEKKQSPEGRIDHKSPEGPIEERIVEILDEYVRPAVEGDGGAIHFRSFEEGRLNLVLQGACSGCPSSSVTLKAGIQALFERMLPEVKEVVAEEV